jgi:hypothetical protein
VAAGDRRTRIVVVALIVIVIETHGRRMIFQCLAGPILMKMATLFARPKRSRGACPQKSPQAISASGPSGNVSR